MHLLGKINSQNYVNFQHLINYENERVQSDELEKLKFH